MLKLDNDSVPFSIPGVHPRARPRIDFQRTLSIPDDGKDYLLPCYNVSEHTPHPNGRPGTEDP